MKGYPATGRQSYPARGWPRNRKDSKDSKVFISDYAAYAVLEQGDSSVVKYELEADSAEVVSDGSVLLCRGDQTAAFDPPWTKDAAGKQIKTWYEVDGTTLEQHVALTEADEYPVVADPRITVGWGVYLNMSGAEMSAVATAVIAAGGTGIIVGCATSKLHTVVRWVVVAVCVYVGSPSVRSIIASIVSVYRNTNPATGYQKKIVPNTGGWCSVKWAGNCS